MHTPKISVIIPVYNAEAYIEKCIRSVMNQTLKEIEIILVNDGSTDNSFSIIKKMAEADDRLRVFSRENKGVSAARNFGLEQAKGEFIGFADADDWPEPTMYEDLYAIMKTNDCDWGICNVKVTEDERPVKTRLSIKDELIDLEKDRVATLQQLMQFKYDNANWNKLYAASVLQKHFIRFDEDMTIWEDLLFNLVYLHFAKKIAVLAAPLYNYRVNSVSLYFGGKWDLIQQFNMLYNGYRKFAEAERNGEELEAFKKEMGRSCYYQVINTIVTNAREKRLSFINAYKRILSGIKKINTGIFFFSNNELRGLQGFKKRLLLNHRYRLFSFIVLIMSYIRNKPSGNF